VDELDVEPKKILRRKKITGSEAAGRISRQQGENLRKNKSVCGQEPWHGDQNKQEE
jgi:hypothetical protein